MTQARHAIAIVQSNYIPWRGYFDLIRRVDHFVLFDDVQYTRRDWRNRNRIKTAAGVEWLTIPVHAKGRYNQTIAETEISDPDWARRHWATLQRAYGRAPCFREYRDAIEALYLGCEERLLSRINYRFLVAICALLNIDTPLHWSSDFARAEGRTERLVSICQQLGANHYLSGPSARGYLDGSLFTAAGISVEWMDYSAYPDYHQAFPPFERALSVVDLLFNEGRNSPRYLACVQAHERV